jgi:DNA-binding NtrC family response regulator
MTNVLIADADQPFTDALTRLLTHKGYKVQSVSEASSALEALQKEEFDLVMTAVDLNGTSGLKILQSLQKLSPRTLALLVASEGSLESAISGIRLGIQDYLLKPVHPEEVVDRIACLIAMRSQAEEIQWLRRKGNEDSEFSGIIGKSKTLMNVLETAKKVAATQTTVLITGDSGTGKELIALAIHGHSDRRDKVFLPVNCGALPETLLESLLFGHKKGSFTGAFADQEGLFEKARGGTIFLDEIGEIPAHLQVKLLRALETKEILPIGNTTPRRIDVRVLAATNRDLAKEVEEGRFRDDLYFRLNILEIHIPPLRERPEDIPLLVEHLIQKHNPELKKHFKGAEANVVRLLMSLPWKGNVRELDNVIEHTMILADGDWLTLDDLPGSLKGAKETASVFTPNLKEALKQFEKQHIRRVLEQTNQDRKEASRLLEISLSSLYRKIEEFDIS